jgi:hypothetical protein
MHTKLPGKMRHAKFCLTSVQHIMPAQQSLVTMLMHNSTVFGPQQHQV